MNINTECTPRENAEQTQPLFAKFATKQPPPSALFAVVPAVRLFVGALAVDGIKLDQSIDTARIVFEDE